MKEGSHRLHRHSRVAFFSFFRSRRALTASEQRTSNVSAEMIAPLRAAGAA